MQFTPSSFAEIDKILMISGASTMHYLTDNDINSVIISIIIYVIMISYAEFSVKEFIAPGHWG